jgi:3-deoxy-manno-octulosonate cytidylyltransferase (CMP-KDO synthetase)
MPVRPTTAELRCSFCNKPQSQVKQLITAKKAAICDACVQMSADALRRSESERIFPVAPPEWVPDVTDPVVGRAQDRFRALVEQALERTQAEIRQERARQVDPRPVAVIPSRYASTRLPAKPLALLGGKPMVQHVHERCVRSGAFARVVVATDDERIASAVRGFGGEALMTSTRCATGTDRVAEAAAQMPEAEWLVNVQGDEPLVHPEALRSIAAAFADPDVEMATLVRPLDEAERTNPAVVKVALARNGDALYFSRADIPFERDPGAGHPPRYGHLGLYGYRRDALMKLARLPPSPLEESEKLEQLRALECGIRIRCLMTLHPSFGIDTPEDLARAEKILAAAG